MAERSSNWGFSVAESVTSIALAIADPDRMSSCLVQASVVAPSQFTARRPSPEQLAEVTAVAVRALIGREVRGPGRDV